MVARGDIEIEAHHTVEDTAIVLAGRSRRRSVIKGIRRFGDAWIPMDETLAHAAVDVPAARTSCTPESLSNLLTAIIPGCREGDNAGAPYLTVINRHVF